MRWLAVALALCACKGKPTHRPPPKDIGGVPVVVAPGSAGSGSGSGAGTGSAPDIEIPTGTGKPPLATTEPIPQAKYVDLARIAYRGFQNVPHAAGPRGMEIAYVTEDKPRIEAVITIAPCASMSALGDCTPMKLDAWKAKEEDLKKIIPKELRVASDLKWEMGTVKVHDTDVIYTFQLGVTQGVVPSGSNAGRKYTATTYAYAVYFNDGHNQIRVIAEYKDSVTTLKEMTDAVPREDLEHVAQGFYDATTQIW
ncbi:MAG: hypothetical protein QM831_13985 [Kofleriaceae bacterium]